MLLLVRDPQLSQVQRHQFSVEKKRGELNSQTFSRGQNTKITWKSCQSRSPISHRFLWQDLRIQVQDIPKKKTESFGRLELEERSKINVWPSSIWVVVTCYSWCCCKIWWRFQNILFCSPQLLRRWWKSEIERFHLQLVLQLRGGFPNMAGWHGGVPMGPWWRLLGMMYLPLRKPPQKKNLPNHLVVTLPETNMEPEKGWFPSSESPLFGGGHFFKFHVSFREVYRVWKDLDPSMKYQKLVWNQSVNERRCTYKVLTVLTDHLPLYIQIPPIFLLTMCFNDLVVHISSLEVFGYLGLGSCLWLTALMLNSSLKQ